MQGWTIASAARWLHVALPRIDPLPRRIELDLPGQLEQELVGYAVGANSPYLRRGLIPSWAKPTLVVRDEQVLTAGGSRAGAARATMSICWRRRKRRRRSTASSSTCRRRPSPIRELLGDFFVSGDVTLGALAEIYGLQIAPDDAAMTLAEDFAAHLIRAARNRATCCRSAPSRWSRIRWSTAA